MDIFHEGLSNITLSVYLDDLIVNSDNSDGHLNDLRAVFKRLRLVVNFSSHASRKVCVCLLSLRYLGHVITADGSQQS